MPVEDVVDQIYAAMKQCAANNGRILLENWGSAVDEKKDDSDPEDLFCDTDEDSEASGRACTRFDKEFQDDFLNMLYTICPNVRINVEEKTPAKHLFRGNDGSVCTVHYDPVDGTYSYILKRREFATGFSISDCENNFTHTVVCIPIHGRVFVASPEELAVLDMNLLPVEIQRGCNSKRVYARRIVSEKGIAELASEGFEVAAPWSAHFGIIDVALGNAAAFLYGRSKPHDSFIPWAFATRTGAVLLDAQGKPLSGKDIRTYEKEGFTKFRPLPSVCYFSNPDFAPPILKVLAKEDNLHLDYLKYLSQY